MPVPEKVTLDEIIEALSDPSVKSVSQAAHKLEVSPQAIYLKLKNNHLKLVKKHHYEVVEI